MYRSLDDQDSLMDTESSFDGNDDASVHSPASATSSVYGAGGSYDGLGPGMGMGQKSSRKSKEDKICGVCGDKALGYNFDAISCESCKAFFRRNAFKGVDYFKCPYDERCQMDTSNRRFCKRCRLKKCFEIGMRKEYILTEEEKMRKRQKIEENRIRKTSMTSEDTTALASFGGEISKVGVGEVSSQTVALSQAESASINELMVAYHKSLEIQMDKDVPRDKANFSDLVNIAELSVRRVIAMAKQVRAFKALPQSDQIHLLKGGSIELLILRSVITFDKEKQHFLDPVDRPETRAMNIDQLRAAESGTGLFDAHMKFVRTLAMDLHADETTLILLLVISLFSPDRGHLIFESVVANHQQEYCMLLQRYLQSRYPVALARSLFPRLLMTLTDIRNLDEEHSHVLLKVNPEGIQPLMKEVFDLSL